MGSGTTVSRYYMESWAVHGQWCGSEWALRVLLGRVKVARDEHHPIEVGRVVFGLDLRPAGPQHQQRQLMLNTPAVERTHDREEKEERSERTEKRVKKVERVEREWIDER